MGECVNGELVDIHGPAVECAYPRPRFPRKPQIGGLKSLLFKLQPNGRAQFLNTLAACEVIPWTIVQLSPKPQMSEHRSSTICAVVERPDHHYGDDLVVYITQRRSQENLMGWLRACRYIFVDLLVAKGYCVLHIRRVCPSRERTVSWDGFRNAQSVFARSIRHDLLSSIRHSVRLWSNCHHHKTWGIYL